MVRAIFIFVFLLFFIGGCTTIEVAKEVTKATESIKTSIEKVKKIRNTEQSNETNQSKQVDVKKSIDKKICTYCSFGYRGSLAADELAKSGIKTDIVNLDGGFAAWDTHNGNTGTKTY